MLKQLCIPGLNPPWLWCFIIFLFITWFSLLTFSLGFLHLCPWMKLTLISVSYNVLSRFWYHNHDCLITYFDRGYFLFLYSLDEFRLMLNFFSSCLTKSISETIWNYSFLHVRLFLFFWDRFLQPRLSSNS
jgi:hypothetical protein